MNGLRKCGIYRQWNFVNPQRSMKFCHSQVNKWNWRTPFKAKLVLLRRPKHICSPSYVEYRPKTNAVILLNMGHTLTGGCTG
jgi:hypothetical protein